MTNSLRRRNMIGERMLWKCCRSDIRHCEWKLLGLGLLKKAWRGREKRMTNSGLPPALSHPIWIWNWMCQIYNCRFVMSHLVLRDAVQSQNPIDYFYFLQPNKLFLLRTDSLFSTLLFLPNSFFQTFMCDSYVSLLSLPQLLSLVCQVILSFYSSFLVSSPNIC